LAEDKGEKAGGMAVSDRGLNLEAVLDEGKS
jgi:hypothetical protein